jgi:glycerate dehydrogenase
LLSAPDLKLVVLAATGTNNVDLEAARGTRHRRLQPARLLQRLSVVQHVLATMLLLTHRLREYDALVRSGSWSRGDQFCLLDFPIRELAGRKTRHRRPRRARQGRGARGQSRARHGVWIANRPGGEPQAGGTNSTRCCRRWTCSACIAR